MSVNVLSPRTKTDKQGKRKACYLLPLKLNTMTPKEKAEELVKRFQFDAKLEYNVRPLSVRETAKQCALIAVDEIIKYVLEFTSHSTQWDYWQEVKNEIKKLC